MNRGEVWTASGGKDYAGNPRPVVIVQSDRFADLDSVTVCPFTSDTVEMPLFRLPIEPSPENGLRTPSRVMIDIITTMPRSKLGARIGNLSDIDRLRLNRAVVVFLGLTD